MGDTVIKDADKLSPYQVRGLVDNAEGSKGLFNHYKIKGIDVGKRIDRRERRREQAKLSTTPKSTNIQKTSSLVNNNEKIMDKQVKQAAFVKLATIKLAINYVIRNRLMNKQAAPNPATNPQQPVPTASGRPMQYSSPMPQPTQAPVNWKQRTADIKKRLGVNGPTNVGWNKNTGRYNVRGARPEMALQSLEEERQRIEGIWNQLTPEEKAHYEPMYKKHLAALQSARMAPTGYQMAPAAQEVASKGWNIARGLLNRVANNERARLDNEGQQLVQQADDEYFKNVAPTVAANNSLALQDDTNQSPLFANGSNLDLEDVLNGNSPESTAPQNAVATNPYMRSQRTMFD